MNESNLSGPGGKRDIRRRIALWSVLFSLLLFNQDLAAAQAIFSEPGIFMVTRYCKAYTSFRNRTGEVDLEINERYVAYAENRRIGASHALIEANGQRKWVSLGCGEYVGGRPPFEIIDAETERCLQFFDDDINPVAVGFGGSADVTPPPPLIEPFGMAVNEMCGPPGKRTSRFEFKQLMESFPALLAELMRFTDGKVFYYLPQRDDTASYLNDLMEAWYALNGFDHIFCGEQEAGGAVGGLHYAGRYLQLQRSGELCRLPNYSQNEVVPGSVYTLGVKMQIANGQWMQKQTTGYGFTLSAFDILKAATRAFAENPTSSPASTGCLLDLIDTGVPYTIVFVRQAKGISTFYPDATPDVVRNPSCVDPIVLATDSLDPVCYGPGDENTLRAGPFRIVVESYNQGGVDLRIRKCE